MPPFGTNQTTASTLANKRPMLKHTTVDPSCLHGNPLQPNRRRPPPHPTPNRLCHPDWNKPHTPRLPRRKRTAPRGQYQNPSTPRTHSPSAHQHNPSPPKLPKNGATLTNTMALTANPLQPNRHRPPPHPTPSHLRHPSWTKPHTPRPSQLQWTAPHRQHHSLTTPLNHSPSAHPLNPSPPKLHMKDTTLTNTTA